MNNKFLLFAFTILVLPETVFTQTLIPKVGISYSTATYKDPSHNTSKPNMQFSQGFLLGIGYEITVNKIFSVQPEFLWVQKGTIQKRVQTLLSGNSITTYSTYVFNYLEVPVSCKFTITKNVVKYNFSGGISLAYGIGGKRYTSEYDNFGSKYTSNGNIHFTPSRYNANYYDTYFDRPLDAGLQAGFGITIADRLIVELRYNHGLANFFDDTNSKNRVIQINACVPIKINTSKLDSNK